MIKSPFRLILVSTCLIIFGLLLVAVPVSGTDESLPSINFLENANMTETFSEKTISVVEMAAIQKRKGTQTSADNH